MSEKNLRLEIVTPQKKVFSEDVSFLVAPGTDGELGILPEHAPLITSLNIGNNKTTVLATSAERAEEIDVARAEAAKRRAEERLSTKSPDLDTLRAELALRRALTRLKAASDG